MPTKTIIYFLLGMTIAVIIANSIIYNMAKVTCEESEVKPVRYEFRGVFGVKTPVPTTPENADAYERVCIKTGEPSFWSTAENINYIVEQITKNQSRGTR